MEKAGYENGMYDGPPLLTIADNESPAKETAEAFQQQVRAIGLDLRFRQVPHATMLTKFCQVPESERGDLPEPRLGRRLLLRAELHRPAVQRREHRAVGQRQHR